MSIDRMRFSCDGGRCYLNDKVPKLGVFDDCFPGKIGFGDVDGLIERRGCFLFIEWKEPGASLTTGQLITLKKLAAVPYFTVLMVEGDNAQMSVESVCQVTENGVSTKRATDLEGLKGIFANWYERANNPSPEPFLKLSTGT
jgi:hypothetical protein